MKFDIDLNIFNHEYVQQSSKDIVLMLDEILTLLRSNTMLTVQDVLNAVNAEQSEVAAALNALTQQVKDLQSVLVTGSQVTQADLQNIITSVEAIFTVPVAPAVAPAVAPIVALAPVDGGGGVVGGAEVAGPTPVV